MRAVWLDAGDNPNMIRLSKWGIRRAYWPSHVEVSGQWVRNPVLNKRYLYGSAPDYKGGWRAQVGSVGIYFGSSWPVFTDGVDLARELDACLVQFGADSFQCAVHVNREQHDFDLVGFLREWRDLRPSRDTSWVIEGMQGGRLTPTQVVTINTDPNLTVFAESFYDADGQTMLPYDADRVRCDLIDFGVQRQRALVMYDGAHLSDRWDGCAFTQGRLP